MEYYNRIVWCEGMLLEPQHFQQQERFLQYDLYRKLKIYNPNHYGIFSLEINTSLLDQGKFNLSACNAIFSDGTHYDAPNHDLLPDTIALSESDDNTKISLAIPLLEPNQLDQRHSQQPYPCKDILSGHPPHADLQIAKLKPSLTTHPNSNDSTLNVAKIKNIHANNEAVLDENFLPACLNIHNFRFFKQFIKHTTGLLQQRCEMLANRLQQSPQASMNEYIDHCLLQTLNRYQILFQHQCHFNQCHPYGLYTLLIQLKAELVTYSHELIVQKKIEAYDHNNLFNTFSGLMREINCITKNILQQHATQLEAHYQSNGLYNIEIEEHMREEENSFIVAISDEKESSLLANDIVSNIKIAPSKVIQELISRALPGITLTLLNQVPRQVPHYNQSHYFKLDKEHPFWNELDASKVLSLHINQCLQRCKFELWVIKEST